MKPDEQAIRARCDAAKWTGYIQEMALSSKDVPTLLKLLEESRQAISTEVAWLERTEKRIRQVVDRDIPGVNAPWIHEEFVVALKSMKAAEAGGEL